MSKKITTKDLAQEAAEEIREEKEDYIREVIRKKMAGIISAKADIKHCKYQLKLRKRSLRDFEAIDIDSFEIPVDSGDYTATVGTCTSQAQIGSFTLGYSAGVSK